jgi:hypothetical protein
VNDPAVRRGFRQYEDQGIRSVEPDAALEALGQMMARNTAVVLMFPAALDKLARSFEVGDLPRAFADLLPSSAAGVPVASGTIREQLITLETGSARRLLLEAHVREKLAVVLKISSSRIDREKTFGSLGLDSLMALEFVRQLGVTTLRLPVTTVFNYPTIKKLSGEIARRMGIAIDSVEQVPEQQRQADAQTPTPVAVDVTEEQAIEALMGTGKRRK